MGQVTASVTIGFATADKNFNTSFSAEVDSRDDGLNGGVTNFAPGATIYILLYQGALVTGVIASASSGLLAQGSTISVTKTETITMAYDDKVSTQCPVTGSYAFTWYGNDPGALTKISETEFTSPTKQIAAGSVTYQTTAKVYTLTGVDVTYPAAVVVFIGTTPA